MSRVRGLVPVLVLLAAATAPAEVLAYGGATHENIVFQALQVYHDQVGEFPELDFYFDGCVKYGSSDEDNTDHVYGQTGWMTTVTHFWDADDADDDNLTHLDVIIPITCPNAWTKIKVYLNWSADEYLYGNRTKAYLFLGHMCHLLADMGVPAHVHLDAHAIDDDCYEDWMSDGGYTHWGAADALAAGGLVPVPEGALAQIHAGVNLYWPEDPMASLYYLMYTTNQVSDWFASDGYSTPVPGPPPMWFIDPDDGDSDDKWGWMNYAGFPSEPRESTDLDYWNGDLTPFETYLCNDCWYEVILVGLLPVLTWGDQDNDDDGDLSNIGSTAYVYAIRATATFYKVWHDYFDPVAPTSSMSLSGLVGDNGWYRSPVETTLEAEDSGPPHNSDGSGIHRIEYRLGAGAPQVYAAPFTIADEGLTDVHYHAMDMFGNWEGEHAAQVKVDSVPPDVSIASPQAVSYPYGFPLSFDFSATDATSGVASVTGLIDGVIPVASGEVVDDLALGDHTLVVTGRDNAGNTSSPAVTFGVVNTPGEVMGMGAIPLACQRGNFGLHATYKAGDPAPKGQAMYKAPADSILVTCTRLTALGIWGNNAAVLGECIVGYNPKNKYTFRMDLVDNGGWNDGDEFYIEVSNGYQAGGVVCQGGCTIEAW